MTTQLQFLGVAGDEIVSPRHCLDDARTTNRPTGVAGDEIVSPRHRILIDPA